MTTKEKESIWEQLLKNPLFSENLEKLPPDERAEVQKALRQLVEQFQTSILDPLQK